MGGDMRFLGALCALMSLLAVVYGHYVDSPRPIVLAHRGSRYLVPENTLLAYDTALAFGADVLELDVYLTRDHHLVVHHDPHVNRTTNGAGEVTSFTLAELQALDAGYSLSPDGQSFPYRAHHIRIPTLDEVFDAFPQANINVEIKLDSRETADALVALLRRRAQTDPSLFDRVLVGGRHCVVLRYFRSLLPEVPTSACETEGLYFVLCSTIRWPQLWLRLVPEPRPRALQIPMQSGGLLLAQPHHVQHAHQLGLKVHFWVINNVTAMQQLLALGADGIVSDRVDWAVPAVREFTHQSSLEPLSPIHPDPSRFPGASVGRFVMPVSTPDEIHTCVTLVCRLMQASAGNLLATAVFGLLCVWVVRKYIAMNRSWRRATVRAPAPPAGVADSAQKKDQ